MGDEQQLVGAKPLYDFRHVRLDGLERLRLHLEAGEKLAVLGGQQLVRLLPFQEAHQLLPMRFLHQRPEAPRPRRAGEEIREVVRQIIGLN